MQKRIVYGLCLALFIASYFVSFYLYSDKAVESCPMVQAGGTLYVSAQDSPLKEGTDPTDNTLAWLSKGQAVTFIETDKENQQLHKVKVKLDKDVVGYLSSNNVDNCKPDLNMGRPIDPKQRLTNLGVTAVVPVAAIRALSDMPLAAVGYAQDKPSGMDFLKKLVETTKYLQDSFSLSSVDEYNKTYGLTPLVPSQQLGLSSVSTQPSTKTADDSLDDECSDYEKYALSPEEKNQISLMSLQEIAQSNGGILWDEDLKCTGLSGCPTNNHIIKDVLTHLYKMVLNLANQTDRKGPYRVCVIGSKSINAFSTPAGDICFTAGLLMSLLERGDDNQLAFGTGHEVCHVILGHGEKAWRKSKAQTCRQIIQNPTPKGKEVALQERMKEALSVSCQGKLDLGRVDKELRDRFVQNYTSSIGCQNYGDDEYEYEADRCALRLNVLKKYRPAYDELLSLITVKKGQGNHPPTQSRIQRLHEYEKNLQPTATSFGLAGWPYTSFPLVSLPKELFDDFASAYRIVFPLKESALEKSEVKGSN